MSSSPELMNTVQRFQPGGVVEPGENVRIPGIPVSGADVKKFLDYIDFDNFIDYLGIRKPKPRSPAGYILGEDPGQRLETISEKVSEYPFIPGIKKALPYVGIATVATPVNKTEAEMQAVDDGKTVQQQMMEQRYPEIDLNEISISANPAFTTNEGADLQAEIEAQKIASEMQKEAEKRKQMEEASATGLPVEDIDFRAKKRDEGANILTGVEEDADKASEAAKIAKELSLYGEGKLREKEVLEKEEKRQDILAEETRMQQGQISASGENIAKSVETGNQDALSSQLKDLMAQFTSNAPKYEGLDKGMALMKIGFAMAAGRSPYAMQNIANALSGGADMFIADKAKKISLTDRFNFLHFNMG